MNTGRTILVTGASSGIGRAVALRLASPGVRLALLAIDTVALGDVADEARRRGAEAMAFTADVSRDEQVAEAIDATMGRWGDLTGVVCAAGIALKGTATTISDTTWHRTLQVNLTGVFHVARHAVPSLLRSGGASFVAVSSDAGVRGSAGYAAYCASKHGVVGLVRCMALDHGPDGLRSNVVCPTFVDTPMADELLRDASPYDRAFYERRIPLGRFAMPDEVAAVITHLLSEEASYTNGMVYVVDGGTTAGTFG